MDMDYNVLKFYFDVAQFILYIALGLYMWYMNRSRVTRQSINEANTRIDGVAERVTVTEVKIDHLPQVRDIARLHDRIDKTGNELAGTTAKLSTLVNQLSLINEHLINKK